MESLIKDSGGWLLTQGVLGLTTMLFAFTTAYLYRSREQDRSQREVDLEEIHKAHAIELAAERKLNLELQEKRLIELRNGLDAIAKFTSTLDTALSVLSKGGRSERAS